MPPGKTCQHSDEAIWASMEVGAITEILGRLVRDGDFLDDGPLRIVLAGLAVAFVDVVVDPSFRQSLTDIFRQGSPR